jgi:hypothetical protein
MAVDMVVYRGSAILPFVLVLGLLVWAENMKKIDSKLLLEVQGIFEFCSRRDTLCNQKMYGRARPGAQSAHLGMVTSTI